MLKHNGGQFYEMRALHTMRIVFPNEFGNLILSDKPDLVDDDRKIGIEVVHPANTKEMEFSAYYYKNFANKQIDEVSKKGLKKFRENGYDVCVDEQSKIIHSYKRSLQPFDMQIIFDAINRKINKLNKIEYRYSSSISLYLEMSGCNFEFANLKVAKQLLDYTKNLQRDKHFQYKEIFFDCLFPFFRCNIAKNEVTEIDLSDLIDDIDAEYDKYLSLEATSCPQTSHT